MQVTKNLQYKHYIAIDWSIKEAEIARMNFQGSSIHRKTIRSDVKVIQNYLRSLTGSKIMTIEETTGSHWLYVELCEHVDKLIICEPYRNSLLSEGPKNDRIDAAKLCILLRSGMLKEVYHSMDEGYDIRKLVRGYEQLVNAGVRIQNQRSALYRSVGLKHKKDTLSKDNKLIDFIESQYQRSIAQYKEQKREYEKLFTRINREKKQVKYLSDISGIGVISSVKIYAMVLDGSRFENKYKYWSYCGLVSYKKESGGRSYGKKQPRYCRLLKGVYRTAALTAIGGRNDIREYYDQLIRDGYNLDSAANQIARYIAKVSYAVMKYQQPYRAYQWRESRDKTKLESL